MPVDPAAQLTGALKDKLNPTATWFDSLNPANPKIDIILTLNNLPPNAWVRVYPRKFKPDALEERGDRAGALVPASGTVVLYLKDPLGLRRPQDVNPASVTIPAKCTLRFDMIVLLPNRNARIYGNVSTPVNGIVTVAPPTGTNTLTAVTFGGVSLAGVLGLRGPNSGPFPTSFAQFCSNSRPAEILATHHACLPWPGGR